jgi:hypothetical protein
MTTRPLMAALLMASVSQAQANIDIQFDYTYDTSGFFADSNRKAVLESVATVFERFSDVLAPITSTGSSANSFDVNFANPANPGVTITLENFSVATNVIRVFVGGFTFSGNTVGQGGPGGFSCSGFGNFCNSAPSRGQGAVSGSSATDVAPWGGSISFDTDTNWFAGLGTTGLTSSQSDFYSVATHELAHLLGFGTSESFTHQISGNTFMGIASGHVALSADLGHWAQGTKSTVNGITQEVSMDPTILNGTRKYFTALDYQAMQDIGWQVSTVPEASTWALLALGLGGVGLATRRRSITSP